MLNETVEQGAPEDLILNGNFANLFHSKHLFFDQEKGDFRIKKQTKRKAIVRGDGIASNWTIKALERIGFEVVNSTDSTNMDLLVILDVSYPEWSLNHLGLLTKFHSLHAVCRYLAKL
jgi:iron complex transport system ATP-binding protein